MDGLTVLVEVAPLLEINRNWSVIYCFCSTRDRRGAAMDILPTVGEDVLLDLHFAKFMDLAMDGIRQEFEDEVVRRYESNYLEFLTTFSPAGPAVCIAGIAAEEVEARNMDLRRQSRSPVAKIPALGYYLRKDLASFSEDDMYWFKWWIQHIYAASYVGSAVFIVDGPVAQQASRSPDELLKLWGPAAYLYGPDELGFTEEPLFFRLVAIVSDGFIEFLKSAGVSTKAKRKLKAIISLYIVAGYILRRLDIYKPGDEPLSLNIAANASDGLT